jgi:hypothetical protein
MFRSLLVAALVLIAGAVHAQDDANNVAKGLVDQGVNAAASVGVTVNVTDPNKPAVVTPTAKVTVVLDGSDVRMLASIGMDLYNFSNTNEGRAMIEALHSGGDSNAIADRFMDAFDRYISFRTPESGPSAGPTPIAQFPVELEVWYHGPTLEAVVKEIIDDIFVSRPWTRIGARFPRISRRIRERMVARCNSLYNRIVWKKLRQLHPQYLHKVNVEIDRFTARFKMDPKQVQIRAYSQNTQGWAGFSLDGKRVFTRSSREIREAFVDVTEKLEQKVTELRQAAAAAGVEVPPKVDAAIDRAGKVLDRVQDQVSPGGAR